MREKIIELLKQLPSSRAMEDRGTSIWMKCPVHANGNENTASFKISLNPPYVGSSYCFACGIGGGWSKTREILNVKGGRFLSDYKPRDVFTEDEEASLLGKVLIPKERRRDEHVEVWPRSQIWRGIPGRIISDVGGRMITAGDWREPLLRLPVYIRGQEKGFIDCKIVPRKDDKIKYLNSKGTWTKDALYPYDYVASLGEIEILFIVEGPRDALITIRNGFPALATLGSYSWNQKCVNLVKALSPELVVLMLDPDEAGEKLRKTIYKDLEPYLPIKSIRLPSKMVVGKDGFKHRKKIIDPADLNRRKLIKVLEIAGIL